MNPLKQSLIIKKTAKILAGKNIPVHLEGFAPRVEYDAATKQPSGIFLPEIPEGASPSLLAAMEGYIDHEVGHILESDANDICDDTKSKLWHYIHNCVEDPRVNAAMSDRFPGTESNIRAGYRYIFDKEDDAGFKPYSVEAIEECDMTNEEMVKDFQCRYSSLWFAKQANCRFSRDKYTEIGAETLFDPLEAKMDKRYLDALNRVKTVEEVRQLTDYFVEFFHKEFDEKGGGGGSEKGGDKSKSKEKGEGRLEDLKKIEDELAEAIAHEIEHLADKAKKNFHFSDRFDQHYDKYKLGKESTADISGFEENVKTVTNYLSKDLRRLLESRNRRWNTGGWKSGKLNQKALHSVRLGNDRIFTRKSEVRDVKAACGLLIDLSGSMKHPHGDAISRVEIAMQSAYAFAMVLDQLRVPFEVYGFTTYHVPNPAKQKAWEEFRKTIDPKVALKAINTECHDVFYSFKEFNENFDIFSKKAMINGAKQNVAMLENEDSAHVKNALIRLGQRPEEKKSLFVFSDGQPSFKGETKKQSQEMLKYLDENSKAHYGVDIFAIGIQSTTVENYYKNHKVVHKLDELPTALFEFLRTRI